MPAVYAAALAADAPTRWAWMGLRFDAPASWAASRHDVRAEAGRLVLVDRRRQRLQMTWSRLPPGARPPDPAALAADWRKRIEAAAGADPPPLTPLTTWLPPEPTEAPDGAPIAWAGWCGPGGGGLGTRTDAVAAVGGRLIDLVQLDPPPGPGRAARRPGAPSAQALALLGSAAPAAGPGGACRWTGLGLDARLPGGWSAALARHEPAASVLAFAGPDRLTARFWRRGMAAAWFDGDAVALLDASTPAGVRAEPGGRPGSAVAAGPEPCRPWPRLQGRARRRRDLLWHDAEANTVRGVTVRGPRRASLPDPASFLPGPAAGPPVPVG